MARAFFPHVCECDTKRKRPSVPLNARLVIALFQIGASSQRWAAKGEASLPKYRALKY